MAMRRQVTLSLLPILVAIHLLTFLDLLQVLASVLSKQGELIFSITRSGGSLDKAASRKPPPKDHPAVRLLTRLDDKLAAVLHGGAIKLLHADVLRSEGSEAQLPRIVRRQELEAMEARGTRIFLSGKEAVAALRAKKRQIAVLTYGWSSPDDPDARAAYLAAVRRFPNRLCNTFIPT